MELFSARLGAVWHPNIGQIYQLLRDLERRRMVVRRDEPPGCRQRRHFRLTPRGERAWRAWRGRRPGWPAPLRDEILVRLLAAERHGTAAVQAQVDRQEEEDRRAPALVHEQGAREGGAITR